MPPGDKQKQKDQQPQAPFSVVDPAAITESFQRQLQQERERREQAPAGGGGMLDQRIQEEQFRRNMEDSEFLEFDAFHTLQPRQLAAQQKQPDNVRQVPLPAPGGIEAPPQTMQAQQRASWKDRHVRKKGSQHLRQIAQAQREGRTLGGRTREEQEANPLEIDREAHENFRAHAAQRQREERMAAAHAAYKAREAEETKRRAAQQMNRGSEKLRKDMMKDERGRDRIQFVEGRYKINTNKMRSLMGGVWELPDIDFFSYFYRKFESLGAEALEVSRLGAEYGFRRECLMYVVTREGRIRRPELEADLKRMEEQYLQSKQKVEAEIQQFVEDLQGHINTWYRNHRGAAIPPHLRDVVKVTEEEEEVVDLKDAESEVAGIHDGGSSDSGIEEI